MYEHEVNAVRMMSGLEPDFKISRAEKERTLFEFGLYEAAFEGLGNVVGLGMLGKGLKAVSKTGRGARALSPSGRMAFGGAMRDAYLRQATREGMVGGAVRFAPWFAADVVTEGLTEGATEIGQTASFAKIDPTAWEDLDVLGAIKDGMILGVVMGTPMTLGAAVINKMGTAERIKQLRELHGIVGSKKGDHIAHWKEHNNEQLEQLESMTPEQRAGEAEQWGDLIDAKEEQIARIDEKIQLELAAAGVDTATVARLEKEKGDAAIELDRLKGSLAIVEDVQTGQGVKISLRQTTPDKFIKRKNAKLGEKEQGSRLTISKAETKHEKKAEETLNQNNFLKMIL